MKSSDLQQRLLQAGLSALWDGVRPLPRGAVACAVLLGAHAFLPGPLLADESDAPVVSRMEQIAGNQKQQIACEENDCIQLPYDPAKLDELDEKIRDLMAERAGKITIRMDERQIKLKDEPFEPLMDIIREISKREGTVVIEPVYIGVRSMVPLEIPVLKDFLGVALNIYQRVRNAILYRHTKHYHAKIIYNPVDQAVMLVYFVNRSYGDICTVLKSNCEELEYIDDETFDHMLSQRLKDAKEKGGTVRVVFHKTEARLPKATLDLETLQTMDQSVRMYKWLVASGKTEKKKVTKERFIPVGLVASVIDYSLKAYDIVQAIIMYLPARSMKAEVVYSGEESGGAIQTVVFSPRAE